MKKKKNNEFGKIIKTLVFVMIKPFIVPLILIATIFVLVCSITDILYVSYNNEDEIDLKTEIDYYEVGSYESSEMKGFFSSVWDFIKGIFGGNKEDPGITGEIVEQTDWPVVGYYSISSGFGKRNAPTAGASTSHSGIDIPAPEGTKLVCVMNGEVTSLGWGGAGRLYYHNSK